MPKRSSTRSMDVNQAAHQMVRRSTQADSAPTPSKAEISRVMASMGRRGGKIGGKRRLETMTAAERQEIAAKAARTRWAKHKK